MEQLAHLSVSDAFARRALVVALGLLGRTTAFKLARPDGEDGNDAAAWVLGAITGDWPGAESRLEGEARSARGDSQDRIDMALARLSMSNGLSALG